MIPRSRIKSASSPTAEATPRPKPPAQPRRPPQPGNLGNTIDMLVREGLAGIKDRNLSQCERVLGELGPLMKKYTDMTHRRLAEDGRRSENKSMAAMRRGVRGTEVVSGLTAVVKLLRGTATNEDLQRFPRGWISARKLGSASVGREDAGEREFDRFVHLTPV